MYLIFLLDVPLICILRLRWHAYKCVTCLKLNNGRYTQIIILSNALLASCMPCSFNSSKKRKRGRKKGRREINMAGAHAVGCQAVMRIC